MTLDLRLQLNKTANSKREQNPTIQTKIPWHQRVATFIWVRLFWNQNLTCRVSKLSLLLSSSLCFSSG